MVLALPILRADDGRSLPQTFEGSMLTSKDIPNLPLYAGHITGNSPHDDGSMEDMTLFSTSPYTSDRTSDDFDFAALGVPGLIFMTRYIKGHNVHVGALDDGEEWGRESELASVVQSGPAKNPTLRWRSSTMRRDWGNNNQFNEQRLIVQYPLSVVIASVYFRESLTRLHGGSFWLLTARRPGRSHGDRP